MDRTKVPQVKYQVITREGQEIVVGRVKIQTPGGGHAFILRRFDTGAISLTTMFRAAFPSASEDAERAEASWVKASYDMSGVNGGKESSSSSSRLRLAGTWVSPDVATSLADLYALGHVIPPLASASPDPNQEYRKSTKVGQTSPGKTQTQTQGQGQQQQAATTLPTPSPTNPGPGPAKRRKEMSPALPPQSQSVSSGPTTRQKSRTASPAPAQISTKPPSSRATRSSSRLPKQSQQQEPVTPAGSELAVIDDDADADAHVPDVPGPDVHEDIAEQRALIEKLKAEREAAGGNASQSSSSGAGTSVKRSLEEETVPRELNFKEPEIGDREVRTNRRITLQPHQKSAAWGLALFAAGFAAMATLPSFFF